MKETCLTDNSHYKNETTKRLENIERVFLNDTPASGLNLTILVRGKDNELVPYQGSFSNFHRGAFAKDNIPCIFADVPPNQPMWAEVTRVIESSFFGIQGYRYSIELHVHNGKDIDGGNWSRTDPGPPYAVHSGKVQAVA